MEIFIGSSKEQLDLAVKIASWLEHKGHKLLVWDNPDLFSPGTYLLQELMDLAAKVDLAILVFGDDDEVWYRQDAVSQPRDNVLIEYGLFSALLGPEQTLICRTKNVKTASDLHGLIDIDFGSLSENRSRYEIYSWINSRKHKKVDPVKSDLEKKVYSLQRQVTDLNDRLTFSEQSARDLLSQYQPKEPLSEPELEGWQGLFKYDVFWSTVELICDRHHEVREIKKFFEDFALEHVASYVEFHQPENNERRQFYTAKIIRALRTHFPNDYFLLKKALASLKRT